MRSALSFAVHRFFQERGFQYIHTPIITTSDCEGAGEMFTVTTLDLNNVPGKDGHPDFSQDFFGRQAGLTVSGQLQAEIYALALGNVYTFGPTFRAENSNTSRHLAEFWMIEPEMAFCDLPGNMQVAEELIKYLVRSVLERLPGGHGALRQLRGQGPDGPAGRGAGPGFRPDHLHRGHGPPHQPAERPSTSR